ncbi:alpha/beta fold hydrolase [Raineyella sp. W15-4]|uniref:alpha/beta fold hydrolase n=1 Tax=Raineyella sp. W15-4 TaxID=3081651 RepID=UPI002952F547|nr:alpha/beta fold hydrolase [Raineyella sp. W15-4]WOQ17400.1 alpha/beta fold hydrolase [Raineyella sp. W15-4]
MTPSTQESTSRFVSVGPTRIHYHEAGTGPVLLCIHGGAPGAYGWGNFGQNVDALAAHHRVLVVDLPGYGRSDPFGIEGGRYAGLAELFARMLTALGIERADVVGMATGGAVAMKLAVDHPDRVDRLVLVSSAGGLPLFTTMPSEGQKAIRGYYAGAGPSPERMEAYLKLMMHDHTLITADLVRDRYQESVRRATSDGPAGTVAGHPAAEEPWREADRITAPTLIVWGTHNRIQGYDNALFLLRRIPGARLHLFADTGLWVPYERAAEFEALLAMFLAEGR